MEELLNNNASIENSVLRVIHFLNIMGYLEVTHAHKTLNFSHQAKRLQRLDGELENKNYFERLGVSRSAKEGDIKKAYFDLAKVLHPDKLSSKTPQEIRQLSEKVFEKIQVAYDTLKRSDKRAQYLDDLEAGQSEKLMQGDQLFDSAKALMNKGQFSQARKLLQQAAKLNTNSSEIKVHLLWSELKLQKASEGFLSDTDKKLNLIPIESRDSAAYYHTRGLYYKMAGDIEKAKKYFNTALNVDNTFISARREISQLPTKKDVNIFNADLKDVVGALFKK